MELGGRDRFILEGYKKGILQQENLYGKQHKIY